MKVLVAWAAPARRSFLGILSYLHERSPQAAAGLYEAVGRQVKRLERFPESGRRVPEVPEAQHPLRELLIDDYRLVYVCRGRRIDIIAIFHGRREFPRTLLH